MAIWSMYDYTLLAAASLSYPVHSHCWDPHIAYELATVGAGNKGGGVSFWIVEDNMGGKKCELQVKGILLLNVHINFSWYVYVGSRTRASL